MQNGVMIQGSDNEKKVLAIMNFYNCEGDLECDRPVTVIRKIANHVEAYCRFHDEEDEDAAKNALDREERYPGEIHLTPEARERLGLEAGN